MSHYDDALTEANAQQAEQDRETARYVRRGLDVQAGRRVRALVRRVR